MQIGIAGTGKMGSAIARRLLECQHRVTVWNRTADRAQPLLAQGAAWAETAAGLAGSTDMVISMVTDEQALDDVYLGAQGLLASDVKGKLFIDMSTVKPAKQQEIAARVAAAGASYLECPVGGSVGPAQDGKLLGFVGGAATDLERARAVLAQLCRRVEHVGPHGAGATMKLAINLPLMVYWQTLGEALSLTAMLDQARLQGRELPLTALALGCFERARSRPGPLRLQPAAGLVAGAGRQGLEEIRQALRPVTPVSCRG